MTLVPLRRLSGGRRALKLLLLQLVLVFSVVSSNSQGPAIDESDIEYLERAPCTVDDLLPAYDEDYNLAKNWVQNRLVPPPFDCTCNTLKARWGRSVLVRGTGKGELNDDIYLVILVGRENVIDFLYVFTCLEQYICTVPYRTVV